MYLFTPVTIIIIHSRCRKYLNCSTLFSYLISNYSNCAKLFEYLDRNVCSDVEIFRAYVESFYYTSSFAVRTSYREILTSYLATWSNIEYVVFAFHRRFRRRNAATHRTIAVIPDACESKYVSVYGRAMPQFHSDGVSGARREVLSLYIKIPIQREAQARMRVTGMYFRTSTILESLIFLS